MNNKDFKKLPKLGDTIKYKVSNSGIEVTDVVSCIYKTSNGIRVSTNSCTGILLEDIIEINPESVDWKAKFQKELDNLREECEARITRAYNELKYENSLIENKLGELIADKNSKDKSKNIDHG